MSVGYYVRTFPEGCGGGVGIARTNLHTVIVVDEKLSAREGVREALRMLTDEEVREWLDL